MSGAICPRPRPCLCPLWVLCGWERGPSRGQGLRVLQLAISEAPWDPCIGGSWDVCSLRNWDGVRSSQRKTCWPSCVWCPHAGTLLALPAPCADIGSWSWEDMLLLDYLFRSLHSNGLDGPEMESRCLCPCSEERSLKTYPCVIVLLPWGQRWTPHMQTFRSEEFVWD
jgi:hypothetical protein